VPFLIPGGDPSGDLTNIDAVREFLQIPGEDITQDDLIESLITRASAAIQGLPGVPVFRPAASASIEFIYRGGRRLSLGRYALRTAGQVQVDTDTSSPTTLTEGTDYWLRPLPPDEGVYRWLKLNLGDALYTPAGGTTARDALEREITITGTWGYQDVPADVEHACIITVAEWLRRNVQAFSTTLNTEAGILDRPEAVPHAAKAALRRYRRTPAP
jgi:hypothetical protein